MATLVGNMVDFNDFTQLPGFQNTRHAVYHPGNMQQATNKSLRLASVLQSTLEVEKLLGLFDDEISAIIPHECLTYTNKEDKIAIVFGESAPHCCSYRLVLLNKDLGELALYRKDRFNDHELPDMENLIAALIYPLRNALLYKTAVEKAYNDPLTGLNNRAAFNNALEQEIELANRHKNDLSIMMIDLDKFKEINDTYGHIAGDTVLKKFSRSMTECMRRSDIIFRYGGEEFIILLRNTNIIGASLLAQRVRKATESIAHPCEGLPITITTSIGVATMQADDTEETLLERADSALYQAKAKGRNRVISIHKDKNRKT